ncbi:MAG: glycoside hydrolase family 3 C-terminal domain-containing protein [Lachnospiraceae bacterium]|jgi:beta-glucosidase|nr:glycoside hydrolase family 3 C-terminal domain-containing protein [Lachnospiraceae bacterium]MCH4063962.1 glycoside hydrolase family 3 C-terminal domain-containing protein [Lachnospiraceae bacterium]MCH4103316.1 glycoside hydrolase family 3 C-terminal domain-containing protein [Lachnospiraceae bacterium]
MVLTKEQRARVETILSQMTLEEKIGQMNQESPSIVGGFDVPFSELIEMLTDGRLSQEEFERLMSTAKQDFHEEEIRAGLVGSVMGNDPRKANELQKIAVEETRLGIPLIIGFDVIHGLRSVFPIAIAEAGSFDDALFEEMARMAARESRAHGISWNFAPMIDVARDSRWGRVSEGPGEDTYLGSRFARAKIRGLQGDTSSAENYVAACTKHYICYGACEGGRDYNTTTMALSQLYNVYLPTFRAAMEEGAATAMAAFNDFNGIPCTVNEFLLRDVLKNELGLEGFVVSDANAIRECVIHGIAEDDADAGAQAAVAGMDMDMGTHIYKDHLKAAVESGRVSMEVIDEAVRRILGVKVWLGLFEHPYVPEEVIEAYEKGIPAEHARLALKAAEESIVLLKNEGDVLPLDKTCRISLVGRLADSADEVTGAWAMGWKKEDCVTILDGFKNAGADVAYYPCGGPEGDINEEELAAACADGDVIVAIVGETTAMSGEASSKADITLPGKQREMLTKLLASGKPVVTVFMNGRPLALGWEAEHLPVMVEAWHLGIQMGNAVAKVLLGDTVPSAKLSASFPYVNGQCPLYYNHPSTGRPAGKSKFTSKYLDAPAEALFPFGYGLSYTTFAYSDLRVAEKEDHLEIRVKIANTGSVAGVEAAQLYMQDVAASLVRPVRELKGYQRVHLEAGEEKEVTFELRKREMGFYDNTGKYCLEDGCFRIYAGTNSRDLLMQEIRVTF